MHRYIRGVAFTLVAALAACSGGGSATPTTDSQAVETGTIALTVTVPPKKKQHARRAHFVGAGTASIVLTLTAVNGGAPPAGFNTTVTVNTTSCPAGPTGGDVCTASTTAPVASDAFTVSAYSLPGGAGSLLSTNVITKTIVSGANTIGLTLDGVVNSLAYATPSVTLANGTAAGNNDSIEALDASGDVIIAAGTGCGADCTIFNSPVYLQADGVTPDYIYWSCNSGLNHYIDSTLSSVANGAGTSAVDGTSISTPEASASGSTTAPGGATVTLVANNAAWLQYNGQAQSAETGTLTCTASDSQGKTATFTGTLGNGTIGWTVDAIHDHGHVRKLTQSQQASLASNAVRIAALQAAQRGI